MATSPTTTQAVIVLLLTVLDTTWRAFVPTIGGTILGVTLDNVTGRAPLFTTLSIILGFILAALLVVLQIRRVRKSR
jgi:tellurite resistance protein TehA-like permease